MPQSFELEQIGIAEDTELIALLRALPDIVPLRFADGEYLVQPGDGSCDVYLVLRGTCVVEPPEGAGHRELAILEATPRAPIFIGEMAHLDTGERSARVRSAMNTFALRLAPAHIDSIIEMFPIYTRVLCREFARRLRQTGERLAELQELFAIPIDTVSAAPGEVIFKAGGPASTLFNVLDGSVTVTAADGRERIVRGDADALLGLEDYLRGTVYAETAVARTPCMLFRISDEHRPAVVRRYPEAALQLLSAAK